MAITWDEKRLLAFERMIEIEYENEATRQHRFYTLNMRPLKDKEKRRDCCGQLVCVSQCLQGRGLHLVL